MLIQSPPSDKNAMCEARLLLGDGSDAQDWSATLGESSAFRGLIEVLRQVCARSSQRRAPTILLQGETGTGKGFFAKGIHRNGSRRDRELVTVNCAAIPAGLFESELFGHERGSFTGASDARPGLFEAAHQGIMFLDEIGALPLDVQAKLLVALEEKQVTRLGARRASTVDVQIVAATHEDLEAQVSKGRFRSDLFHRLNVVSVTIPPLRERGGDAVLLAEAFLTWFCEEYGLPKRTLSNEAKAWIESYAWPGNVRELRNRIERLILVQNDEVVSAAHLGPAPFSAPAISLTPTAAGLQVSLPSEGLPMQTLECAVLREALDRCLGNVSKAARFLSISRQTLIYRIKKHRLNAAPPGAEFVQAGASSPHALPQR